MASLLVPATPRFGPVPGDRRVRPQYSPGARSSSASRAATRAPGVTVRRAVSGPVRLTRRGRMVSVAASVLMLGAVVIGAGQVADASAVRAQGSVPLGESTSIVVQSGQTLWGIAREVAPDHDPRLIVSQIRDLNDLDTRPIVPGQALIVPTLD